MGKRLSFLMMCLLSTLYLLAQGPGGVSGAELWQIATATSKNTDSNYVWCDYSGDSIQFVSTANNQVITRPQSELLSFNFHPALHFDSISGKSVLQHANMGQTTLIGVFAPDSVKLNKDSIELYQTNSNGYLEDSIFMSTKSVYDKRLSTLSHKYLEGNDTLFYQRALKTITYERVILPNHSVWGEPETSSLLFNADGRPFTGYCPEMIVYGRMLSQLERRKVETYLAIKYGITLWGSFISPDNQLIWDSSDLIYHNRVTAIAKFSSSLLSQLLSTTSYEEYPRFSVLPSKDSFYKHSTYNKPTPHRLITLGHEYGYNLPDNTYMIWGDNDLSIDTTKLNDHNMWSIMNRKWKLNSNLPSKSNNSTTITSNNIEVTEYNDGYYSIYRPYSISGSSYVKFGPQTSNDLHISFICPEYYPDFQLGVRGSNDVVRYGYNFKSNGEITIIIDDNEQLSIYHNAKGCRIDLYKKGDDLYLQINGEGKYDYHLDVPVRGMNPFNPRSLGDNTDNTDDDLGRSIPFGHDWPVIPLTPGYDCCAILVVSPGTPLQIGSLHVDGFSDTGNQLELSYSIAKDLKAFRKNRSILLVNESSDFSDPDNVVQRIPCCDFDVDRQKLLFHNIFFNQNETSYFTFATYDGLIANFTPVRAYCDNDYPTNTGQLIIDIKCGSPLYNVNMKEIRDNSYMTDSLLTGITPSYYIVNYNFGMNHLVIDSLYPGKYELNLSQRGGNNIYASPYPSDDRFYSIEFENNSCSVSWFVTDTLSYYVAGFTDSRTGEVTAGFLINGSRACSLNNVTDSLDINIVPGDSLAVNIIGSSLQLVCNNETLTRTPIDCSKEFRAKFHRGEATLANVNVSGGILNDTISDESIMVEQVLPFTISKCVFIGYECDSTSQNEVVDTIVPPMNQAPRRTFEDGMNQTTCVNETFANNSALKVTHRGGKEFTAELDSPDTGIAQLLVFDTLGRLIAEGTMSGGAFRTVSFSVPAFGVYIVKVLTDHKEYSEKILCK